MADDLLWDFTGDSIDEETAFLITNSKSDTRSGLTRRETEYIVKNLEDTARILGDCLRAGYQQKSGEQERQNWFSRLKLPTFITNHILGLTIALQALNIISLSIIDASVKNKSKVVVDVGSGIMITFEVLNLLLVILTSAKLTKQLVTHKVSSIFLAQSYFASVLLFAGIYTVTYRLDRKSWKFIGEILHDTDPALLIIDVYLKMLYLSVSTATLCGASSIGPKEWYNYLCMSLQMLLSFVYFTSILSLAMGNLSQESRSQHLASMQQSAVSGYRGGYTSGRTSRNSIRYSYGSLSRRSSRHSLASLDTTRFDETIANAHMNNNVTESMIDLSLEQSNKFPESNTSSTQMNPKSYKLLSDCCGD